MTPFDVKKDVGLRGSFMKQVRMMSKVVLVS